MTAPFLSIRNLGVTFTGGMRPVRAVNDVSLDVAPGEAVALIGESGSGKSVTMRAVMRLNPEKKSKLEGQILVGGRDVMAMDGRALSGFRGGESLHLLQPWRDILLGRTSGRRKSQIVKHYHGYHPNW
jgi:peptide/nickel transport system ATP-binding protein